MTTTAAQLAEAEQLAAQLRTQHQAEQAAANERYETARAEWAHSFLAGYPDAEAALLDEEKEAEKAFRAAVLADPMVAAFVRMRAARYRVATLSQDAENLGNRYGGDLRVTVHRRSGVALIEEVVRIVEREAGNIGQGESDARYAEMEAAGQQARQAR